MCVHDAAGNRFSLKKEKNLALKFLYKEADVFVTQLDNVAAHPKYNYKSRLQSSTSSKPWFNAHQVDILMVVYEKRLSRISSRQKRKRHAAGLFER